METLIYKLPYTPANRAADEESKRVGDTIGEDKSKALLETLVEAIQVEKVETFSKRLSHEKSEAIMNMPA